MSMFKGHESEINDIRNHFGQRLSPHYCTDQRLFRWVTGWDGRMNDIYKRLEAHLEFRNSDWKLDDVTSKSYLETFSEIAQKHIPGGLVGYDKSGNVVVVDPLGAIDPKGVMGSVPTSELIRRRFQDTEYNLHLLSEQEEKLGKRCGMVLINDLEGLSMDHLNKSALQVYITIISLLQDQYPDLLAKVYVIKGPSILKMAYNLIYPFLAKKTREKVEFLGADWKDRLAQEIDLEILPKFWGGSFVGKFGEHGDVAMGGKVPEDKYYSALSKDPRLSTLTELKIGRGEKKTVSVKVDKLGSKLTWLISMPAHDISFRVYFETENQKKKPIIPNIKICCEFVPESGQRLCNETGIYTFEFDNTFSMVRGKTVNYHISVHSEY